jgi:hypothetical protein
MADSRKWRQLLVEIPSEQNLWYGLWDAWENVFVAVI